MSRRKNYARRKGKDHTDPFVQLHHWVMKTAAWRDLDAVARALYVELKTHYNGANNGTVGLGVRDAGVALGMSSATAWRAFVRLQEHGFIEATSLGKFGNGYHLSTEWLLLEAMDDRTGDKARKDFVSQDFSSRFGIASARAGR